MITMDYLYLFTKSEVTVEDNKQVTLAFDAEVSAEEIILGLLDFFGRREKQQAVRLVVGGEERGYLLRTDLYHLLPLGVTRGIGDSDGASLPGATSGVTLTELCCPNARCKQVLLVTAFDEKDPPMCDAHAKPLERCK
jgi:hypothetical protein